MPGIARKALLLLLSTAIALVAAELALRVVGYGRLTPRMSFGVNTREALDRGGFEPDAHLFWTLPARPGPLDAQIGAIHPGRPVPAKDGRRRVIVLGDSCSRISLAGLPYSALLGERLGAGWEVLNAAVPGYTSHQGLTWLREQLLGLAPDVVVVYFGWNDHWRSSGLTDAQYEQRLSGGGPRLLSLLRRRPRPAPLRVPLDEYAANLRVMIEQIRGIGARPVLVAAPSHFTFEAQQRLVQTGYILPGEHPGALHERYLEAVRRYAGVPGVAVLAADRLFDELAAPSPLLLRDGIHLTDEGHAVMAAALAALITAGTGADGTVTPDLLAAAEAALPAPAGSSAEPPRASTP